MDVIVRSRDGQVPPRLRAIAQRKMQRLARLEREAARADVQLVEERNPRIRGRHVCMATVQLRRGSLVARAAAATPETALDHVLEKLRHQAERRKDEKVRTTRVGARRAGSRGRARS